MAYLNEVKLIGNLGKTPEVRYLPNGDAVINVGLATTKKYKDRDSGEVKERTEWHNLVAFAGLAEIFGKYTKKGSSIYVSGELRTRKWTDKDGVERYTTEVHVENMQMLGSAPNGVGSGQHAPSNHGDDMPPDALPPAAGDEYQAANEPAAAPANAPAEAPRKASGSRKPCSGNGDK